jgi:hypothetical protein
MTIPPGFKYDNNGILVPTVSIEYPTGQSEISSVEETPEEIPERNDATTVEVSSETDRQEVDSNRKRKRKKRFKLKR